VFGGPGSGKTVLISSFFGAAQEQAFVDESLFHVIADDTGQGNRLRQTFDSTTPARFNYEDGKFIGAAVLPDDQGPEYVAYREVAPTERWP
jgi:hypothetical protein